MKYPLILLVLILLSCVDNERDPLIAQLRGYSWSVEKAELIEDGKVVGTLLPDPDTPLILSFGSFRYAQINDSNVGCGQWIVVDGKLRFNILYNQIIAGLCLENAFTNIFTCDNRIELTDTRVLIVDGLCGTFNEFTYLDNWFELVEDISLGKTEIRTYFVETAAPAFSEQSCCGKL